MAKKEAGVILVDGKQVASTKQCCHCGLHFISQKGSGNLRGFCMTCHEVTCGRLECCKCIPFEKKLDLIESGQSFVL
ncbi:MAG: hypothetical protein GY928_25995 [Colwellia sp.]|nr:hypothetical protein [Colwellia sp.]